MKTTAHMIKAIIFDLDNTIYPVPQIGTKLFAPLFELIEMEGDHSRDLEKIKDEIMRTPFQKVAKDHHFSEELTSKCINILKELAYTGAIEPFADFEVVRGLPVDKFLVTTGFTKMQQSKVDRLELAKDFKEIHIIDPTTSKKGKKDVFADIIQRYEYDKEDVIVVGDDVNSEIKAAHELGVEAVWYDKYNRYEAKEGVKKIADYRKLVERLLVY
ncbi:HAD family hydrolase [Niastella sp. OAS944]|uniref:HAD family hydrolase n=1 Tax=Niastella sp. OAS944 TaxID=2664089 RepID=UPI003491D087|nr:putative hydrolase of the HAD superfamily [Chitinophagaceae bacterium OAS944]